MPKHALILFWCGLVLVEVNSAPLNFYDDLIGLLSLPFEAFDTPKESTGEILDEWVQSGDKTKNPEELGEYYQGDIVFPPRSQRNGLISKYYRWPLAVVPYVITGPFSAASRANIDAVMKSYRDNSCIKFVERVDEIRYINMTNTFTGCWSYVGRVGLVGQQVNLQDPGCTSRGTIGHEILHALGFFHEQSRPDRDTYVEIHYGNIISGYESNFDKLDTETVTAFGVPYDYGSVMHYSEGAFSANGNPTITTKPPGIPIGQRDGLSPRDFQKLNAMYKCIKTSTGWVGPKL